MTYLKLFCAIFISVTIVIVTMGTITSMSSQALNLHQPLGSTTDEIVIFDFETIHLEGWENSTKRGQKGISALSLTSTQFHSGQQSLAMTTHLSYSTSITDFNEGIASVMFPGNMDGRTITAWVKCSTGATGDVNHRNGVQLFVTDQNFKSQFASWANIGTDIPENQWIEIKLIPSETTPLDGYTGPGFDPTKIQIVGIKLGSGTNSQMPFQGICYLDVVKINRASPIVPDSDHTFSFNNLMPVHQQDKTFGYGPYWDIDSGWQADAWGSNDIAVQGNTLAITSTFTVTDSSSTTDPNRVGFIGIEHLPSLDINNKSNRVVRAEVRFDPYIGPERMIASIFVYDRRDACENKKDNPCNKWYISHDIQVGGSVWNEITFDLDDSSQFKMCSDCLAHSDITTDSLKNILKVGIQFYANESYTGTIYLDNVTVGGREKSNCNKCNDGFVTRSGPQFLLKGEPYRFVGSNVYYPFAKSHHMIDDVMQTYQRNDIQVLRTWGFSDGKAPYADDGDNIPNGNEGSAFQPEKGLCYEPTFVNFDYVVKSAGEHGIRLIIPLVNYWSDQDKNEHYQKSRSTDEHSSSVLFARYHQAVRYTKTTGTLQR